MLHNERKAEPPCASSPRRSGADLADSWAYSDSRNDIPLLELVGNRVVVNPDVILAHHAQQHGWPMLRLHPESIREAQRRVRREARAVKKSVKSRGTRRARPDRGRRADRARAGLLLVATLVTRLAKQLAVLLLRHALAALLDDGTHVHLIRVDDGQPLVHRHEPTGNLTCGVYLRAQPTWESGSAMAASTADSGMRNERPKRIAGQVSRVHEAVDGHVRDAHHLGHLGDREEAHVRQFVRHSPLISSAPV